MSKRKLRKIAKNIRSQPALKKKLASFFVEVWDATTPHEKKSSLIADMLMNGNRGFLAMSEDELCKRFDQFMVDLEANKVPFIAKLRTYNDKGTEREEFLKKAEEVADDIFEKLVLLDR